MQNHKTRDWNISDLVDLEFFFVQDKPADERSLSRRDRELYLTHLNESEQSPSTLIHRWLKLRKESQREDQASPFPGEAIRPILRIFPFILFMFGGITGISLSRIVVSSGNYINVFFALLALVVLPFLFTLGFAAILPAWRYIFRKRPAGNGGEWFVGAILSRLSRLLQRRIKGQKRLVLNRMWGNLRSRSSLYSGVMSWFTYSSFQLFGLGFSLGVLGTIFLLGLFTSLSFGWGTTIGLNETTVYWIVNLIAAPWEALGLNQLHPTIDQVRESLIASNGKSPLLLAQNEHLRNVWAKFFLWAVTTYTVLPRLVLFGVGYMGNSLAFRQLSFNDCQCAALLRRMKNPQVRMGVEGDREGPVPGGTNSLPDDFSRIERIRVLIPSELMKRPEAENISREILSEFNVHPEMVDQVELNESLDSNLLHAISRDTNSSAVIIIFESWQPCINATLAYLRTIRQALGRDRSLTVCLIGRENKNSWATQSADHDLDSWRHRLEALGDPYLSVHGWGTTYD